MQKTDNLFENETTVFDWDKYDAFWETWVTFNANIDHYNGCKREHKLATRFWLETKNINDSQIMQQNYD